MRKLAQEQASLTAIHEHQFSEREVRRQVKLESLLPASDFIKKAWETMNVAVQAGFRFAGAK
jgi:hypothetical protein